MNTQDLLDALQLGEDKDWEFKSAKGGLPGSFWETYSAMANTDGGCIVLGVKESGEGEFEAQGLDKPDQLEQNFWDLANNRNKVSLNLLSNNDVQIMQVEDKQVLAIQVRRATRKERPVYVGQNPLTGTYRRYREGRWASYRLSPDKFPLKEDNRSLSHNGINTDDPKLIEIALPAREKSRLPPEETEGIILQLCEGHFLSVEQIGLLLNRSTRGVRSRFLSPLVSEGKLKVRYPSEPTHPDQAYTTNMKEGK